MSFDSSRARLLTVAFLVFCVPIVLFFGQQHGTEGSSWKLPVPKPEHDEPSQFPEWHIDTPPTRFLANSTPGTSNDGGGGDDDTACRAFPAYMLNSIQIVLKTGVGEAAHPRTDAQSSSILKCITNLLVFSDLEYDVGPWHTQDLLRDQIYYGRVKKEDETAYFEQQRDFGAGNFTKGPNGHKLDRYKFLPMVQRAHEVNPRANWYIFTEIDTFVSWDNLFRLLDSFDPSIPHYIGAPTAGRDDMWFAYGGTGTVLSQAAAVKLLKRDTGKDGEFVQTDIVGQNQKIVREDCCGDALLSYALFPKRIKLRGLYPMFCTHPLRWVRYTKGRRIENAYKPVKKTGDLGFWCQPVITVHQLSADDIQGLWEFEQARDRKRPLLFADILDYAKLDENETRENWFNAKDDTFEPLEDSRAHASFESCGKACRANDRCFQYNYHASKCTLVSSISIGDHRDPEGDVGSDEDKWFKAGWDLEKIKQWRDAHPCDEVVWEHPSYYRRD